MKHRLLVLSCAAALGITCLSAPYVAGPAMAADAPLINPLGPAAPATQPGVVGSADLEAVPLGHPYESQSEGISFRPPTSCVLVDTISSKYLAEWSDPQHEWTLKLGKLVLDQPTPLLTTKGNFDKQIEGVLPKTVNNLIASLPGCVILRQDVANTHEGGRVDPKHPESRNNIGLIAVRYTNTGVRHLSQQAIIQAGDNVYYLLTLTSPGQAVNADAAQDDPREKLAAETFERMIDSVRLLDRSAIKRDQDDRLFHTRAAIVNWTPMRFQNAMLGQQWVRILKDGKDVGYSYISEDRAGGIPRPLTRNEMEHGKREIDIAKPGDGILIGVRARMIAEGTRSDRSKGLIQSDSASWFFISADKKHEDFSRVVVTDDHKSAKKGYLQEFGVSEKRVRRMVERAPEGNGSATSNLVNRPDELTVSYKEDWELNVSQTNEMGMAPQMTRKLPPFYVPQALTHLLPRLLPLQKPQNYLFATYVCDAREVIMRYIDVLPEQRVSFAGQSIRAVPVQDRLGLEGSVTTHYLTIDGRYLGSENKDQKLVMLPTDASTLQQIWQDANLTKPGGIEQPNSTAVRGAPALVNPNDPAAEPRTR